MSNKLRFDGSWKTTVAGIAAILTVVADAITKLTDGNPGTNPDWNIVIATVSAGLVGLFARDNNKSSEDVGVKHDMD